MWAVTAQSAHSSIWRLLGYVLYARRSACLHSFGCKRCTALRARLLSHALQHRSSPRDRRSAEAASGTNAGALPDRAKLRARPNETLRGARAARPLRRVRLGRPDAGLEYSTAQGGPPLLERRRVLWIFCGRSRTAARKLLDLGSGVGSVGLITLWRSSPEATLTCVEAQSLSHDLCRRTIARNNLQ